jgi:PPOX class probable F420-dependent enzyme
MLNAAARALIESGALAHLVTINEDGSAQVSVVWVGMDGDELVSAHLDGRQKKLANMRRDPRVVLSFEAEGDNGVGMRNCLVVHGRARISEGGRPRAVARAGADLCRAGHPVPSHARPAAGVHHIRRRHPGGRAGSLVRLGLPFDVTCWLGACLAYSFLSAHRRQPACATTDTGR